MSDVKTIDVRTGVETMRAYTDAEKAQIAKDETEYPARTFEELRRMRDQKLAETDWVVTKAVEAGVDALVCEGFEAGGHNGREETTTFCLIPLIKKHINIPLIAAGGICSGKSMLAAMVLGADAVQIGSRFVVSQESSAHIRFKNKFYLQIEDAYANDANIDDLKQLLGRGRAKKGMFLGDLNDGELEIGQVSALLEKIQPAKEIINDILTEFNAAKKIISASD